MKKYLHNRTFYCLSLGLLLVLLLGNFRPDKHIGEYPCKYWENKLRWNNCADVLFIGDSRVYTSVDPATVSTILPGKDIYNFGFSSQGYHQKYLDAASKVLKHSKRPVYIVAGITPGSLTPESQTENGFIEESSINSSDREFNYKYPFLVEYFKPMKISKAIGEMFGQDNSNSIRKYYSNGWMARDLKKHNKHYLKKTKSKFEENLSSPEIRDLLVSQISSWVKDGVIVIAFRPPTCEEMIEAENQYSGFLELQVKDAVVEAGGIWLEVDQDKYESFDTSHLTEASALEFSKDLALKLKDYIK